MRDFSYLWGGMTRAVRILLWAIAVTFIIQVAVDGFTRIDRGHYGLFTVLFGLWPAMVKQGYVWQLLTYNFLHSPTFLLHIVMNGMFLLFIGPETERAMGSLHFTIMYFLSGILGGLVFVISASHGLCVGASGAIFGVFGAFVALYPNQYLTIMFLPMFTFRARTVGIIMLVLHVVFLSTGSGGNVAYSAHVGGGLAGYIYAMVVFRSEWLRWKVGRFRPTFTKSPRVFGGSELTDQEVDVILDKIAAGGMSSLSKRERRQLELASKDKG